MINKANWMVIEKELKEMIDSNVRSEKHSLRMSKTHAKDGMYSSALAFKDAANTYSAVAFSLGVILERMQNLRKIDQ